ncbi:MAG: hypothetical protein O7D94_06175 [Planctomycetota bacterium]|nr:hypothetical protein [Planctomycetota bacterium]
MKDPDGQLKENADEAALQCPTCAYILTGLSENRCPECGLAFDPDHLRSDEVLPATPWDRRPSVKSFLATWWIAAVEPQRLAREFPNRHSIKRARQYSGCCYGVAALVFCTLTVRNWVLSFENVVLAGACGIAACASVEFLVANALARLVKPTNVDDARHFWRGLAHYTSGFVSLTGGLVAAMTWEIKWIVPVILGPLAFSWWSASLILMVLRRTRTDSRNVAVTCVVPALGLVGISLTVFYVVLVYNTIDLLRKLLGA